MIMQTGISLMLKLQLFGCNQTLAVSLNKTKAWNLG